MPYELLDNEKVIEEAIKNNQFGAEVLEYASERLKDNKDLVLIAANSYFNSLYDYYDQGLGGEELEGSVNIEDSILEYISDELRNDRDVILAIVNNNPYAFVNIPDKFKDDYDIALIAFKEDECLIETASEMVKKLLKNQ